MPMRFLQKPGVGRTISHFKPGQPIFEQARPAEHVFYMQQGRAKEVVVSGQGREAIVGVIEAGMFFGTSAMNGTHMRRSSVIAMIPCVVTAITIAAMQQALTEPAFVKLFVRYLIHKNNTTEAEKIDLLFNSREKRLAQRLLQLAKVTEGPPQKIGPEMTHEIIARMVGTTRPHVSTLLMKFRRLGFIAYDGGIVVQPTLLQAVLEESPTRGIEKSD